MPVVHTPLPGRLAGLEKLGEAGQPDKRGAVRIENDLAGAKVLDEPMDQTLHYFRTQICTS